MTITLNAEQEQAVALAHRIAREHGIGVVAGPAGTGKSTLLNEVCRALGQVVLIAPTNRAAQRVTSLTGQTAGTIHSWMYRIKDRDAEEPAFVRRSVEEINIYPSNLIVVDEASMVGQDLWEDIWTVANERECGVLLVGDAFQLPPVTTTGVEFSVFDEDFQKRCEEIGVPFGRVDLVKVWRQAAESPIIRAVTEMRKYPQDWRNAVAVMEGRPTHDNPDGYKFAHPANVPVRLQALIEDGVDHCAISFTNERRHEINREVRGLLGYKEGLPPQVGEPLLVRRNCQKAAISNGEIIKFTGFVEPPGGRPRGVPDQYKFFYVNGVLCCTNIDMIATGRVPPYQELRRYYLKQPFIEANFGYAITAHAGQGHEFDWAIVNWESTLMVIYSQPTMRIRWLYTSFSRAKKKLLIGGLTA